MQITASARTVMLKNLSYTSAESFKTAMSGVILFYELETPAEEPIDADLIFNGVQVGGTEQILPENTSVPITAPILADMSYSSGYIDVITHPNPIPGGETSGDGRYLIGEEATINAVPNEHYVFKNWELDNEIVSTDPEYTFEVSDE